MWITPGLSAQMRRNHEAEIEAAAERARRVREARRREEARTSRFASAMSRVSTTDQVARAAGGAPAAKAGGVIEVGGTTAIGTDGRISHPGDPYLQTKEALARLETTLVTMGASLQQVVRTRVYLKKTWQADEVARAHRDVFDGVRPATTFVGAGALIDPDALVEIEATAHVG